jgi:glycosyltransferase involved in cell wall biosynthesis
MRILIVGPAQSIHVHRWARYLAGRGHAVTVFSERPPAEPIEHVTVRLVPLSCLPRPIRLALGALALRVLQHRLRPDVTHVQSVGSTSALVVLLTRARLVVTPWGGDVLAPSSLAHHLLAARALRRASLVLTTSQHMRAQVQSATGARALPIATISWGADTTLFRPASDSARTAAREAWGLPADATVLASTRSTDYPYRVLEILEAFVMASRARADLHLVLLSGFELADRTARDRERRYQRRVWDLARTVEKRVTLIDRPLAEPDVASILAAADAVISIPATDQRATSVLEALCCGLPVLAADIPPYRELLNEGFAMELLEDPIRESLARAMTSVRSVTSLERAARARLPMLREDREAQYRLMERALESVARSAP